MLLKEFLKLSASDLKGKIFVFPTDTVYGIGCLIEDEIATKKIYDLKTRELDKPLAILCASEKDIQKYVMPYSLKTKELINSYWPGALTIVFKTNNSQKLACNANLDTIGFRVPNSQISLAILEKFGPVATTSVNISHEAPLNDPKEIKALFGDKIDYIIEDTATLSSISSTVVDATKEPLVVLRQGSIKIN